MRVFIGLSEVANCVHNYGAAFRELGVKTFTVVGERAWPYPDSEYDIVLSEKLGPSNALSGLRSYLWRIRYYLMVARAMLTCDVFIFTFGGAFRADRKDFKLLKKLGKRIVCVFLGDDVRYWYAYTQEAELLGTAADIRPYIDEVLRQRDQDYLATKLKTVQQAEEYADLILGLPDCAQLQSKPYMRTNLPLDLSRIGCAIHNREVPLVLHAPSVRDIKGTKHVLAAVERLRAEGLAFEFRLIERATNTELCKILADADIVVDQLYSETVATLALEAMAAGNVVLARYLPEKVRISAGCPVISVNVATLTDRLREVIVDRDLRERLARAGRPYVEKYHARLTVAKQILEWLHPARREDFDFQPTFFREHFVMSSAEARREADLLREEPAHVRAASIGNLAEAGVRFDESLGSAPAQRHLLSPT